MNGRNIYRTNRRRIIHDRNNNVTVLESLKSGVEISLGFLALIGILFKVISYIDDYSYSKEAEYFYEIPQEYFFSNPLGLSDSFFLISMTIIYVVLLSIISFFIHYYLSKDNNLNFLSIPYILLLCILTGSLIYLDFKEINNFSFFSLLTLCSITIFILLFIWNFYKKRNMISRQIDNNFISTCIQMIRLFFKLFNLSHAILIILFICLTWKLFFPVSLSTSYPQDKTEYEIVTIKNSEDKFAVISTLDDKFVLMGYTITTDRILSLEKGHYSLENKENCIIEYRTFKKTECK